MEELNEMREKEYRIRGERLGREHGTASFCPALERMLTPLTDLGGRARFSVWATRLHGQQKGKEGQGLTRKRAKSKRARGHMVCGLSQV
jgi:hypothetical protein